MLSWKQYLQVAFRAKICALVVQPLFILSSLLSAHAEVAYPEFAKAGFVPDCVQCSLKSGLGAPDIELPLQKNLYEFNNGFIFPHKAGLSSARPELKQPVQTTLTGATNNWGLPTFNFPSNAVQTHPSTWFDTKKIIDSWGWNLSPAGQSAVTPATLPASLLPIIPSNFWPRW